MYSFFDEEGVIRRMVPRGCLFGDRTSPRIACTYSMANTHFLVMMFPDLWMLLTYVDDNVVLAIEQGKMDVAIMAHNKIPESAVTFKRVQQTMDVTGLHHAN